MRRTNIVEPLIWIVTPFEKPDAGLASAAAIAGAFPVLHLGRNRVEAETALEVLAARAQEFGVCIAEDMSWDITLPENVSKIILPWGTAIPANMSKINNKTGTKAPITTCTEVEIVWQIHCAKEAFDALEANVKTLIIKGAEGAGMCGEESSFILFQSIIDSCTEQNVNILIQGGVGMHTAAAYIDLGATGVILDSQVALFSECGISQKQKNALSRLSGNEIRTCEGYNYYVPLSSGDLNEISERNELYSIIGADESDVLPLGQDVIIATDLVDEYKRLKRLVRALKRAPVSHLKQSLAKDAFSADSATAKSLGTTYPIAQGPMARISDEPSFLKSVFDGGALPFLAMSMMRGKVAADTLRRVADAMGDKSWGVGVLGFADSESFAEQTKLIIEAKPPFVLIAGGRPSQGKAFEREGIQALLHAPTSGLLDMFLNEGARSYVFEGRESGGHVGPLFSTVLWEKQINRILKMENPAELRAFFAGGIHDALSAAFVRIAVAPLTARGVKVGLLCGTAYLYTEEAIRHHIITDTYQRLLIENDKTLLLKSGKGQETRCVASPFAHYFLNEKARLEKEEPDLIKRIMRLEELNLGRLRIASKGLERVENKLTPLTNDEQIQKGLYMTGAVTALIEKTTTIKDIHENLTNGSLNLLMDISIPETPTQQASTAEDIAVIGMAGIFPGAENVDEFWRNAIFGRDCITEVPEERWSTDMYYDPDPKDTDHVASKWGGFLGKSDFDALEFGITPQSLAAIEPVQLLSLLVAKRALEDAGFTDLSLIDMDDTAVIFGVEGGGELSTSYGYRAGMMRLTGEELPRKFAESFPQMTEDSFPGVLGSVVAGRVSNRLDTGGHNFTVDAACASSLAALDIAVTELATKKADMVVLGGADLHNGISDYLMFSCVNALSKKGRCAAFDSDADGTVISESVGAVILKRLKDAERDGNKIYAVIKGVGGSSDGKQLGLTAPNKRGQIRSLENAYEFTGVKPSDVGLIEAHGTGTVVGDRAELQALNDFFTDDGLKPGQIALCSLKSQIGHSKAAAGIAGLIKAVNCVRHGIITPTLHLKKPNDNYTEYSPFFFRTEKAGFWHDDRRIAGLSSFGFGGTNFHVIIENYKSSRPETPLKTWPSELFVFPGETLIEAVDLMDKITDMLNINDKLRLIDIAYSLANKCGSQPVQFAIVAGTREELLSRIDNARNGMEDNNIYKLNPIAGKVAFLFPGQGSQRVNMAADLFIAFPSMRTLLNGYREYDEVLFPHSVFTEADKKAQREKITDTRNAQPLLGIVDMAIAKLLENYGITPDIVAGHSYGELPALCFAKAFEPDELVPLSQSRADSILTAIKDDPGRMVSVLTDKESLSKLLEGQKDVWVVNYNAPRQTVIAGTTAGIEMFLEKAESAGVTCKELNVACAFHSPLLKDADKNFADALQKVRLNESIIPVMSNTDASLYPKLPQKIAERLAEHLVNPVRFTEEIENMNSNGVSVFIETGPGGALTKLVSEILKNKDATVIQTEQSGSEGVTFLLQGLAKYIATGRMIKMDKLFDGREAVSLDIDEPQIYKKKATVWSVDGKSSLPTSGKLPPHAGKNLPDKMSVIDWFMQDTNGASGYGNVDQVMLSYLYNMNAMIQDQRDVMLGYLGATDIPLRSTEVRRAFPAHDVLSEKRHVDTETEQPIIEAEDGLPDISSLTTDQITEIIFEVVSDKTGYPIEMLNLEMDFEADLSIDSIKKMEIIGELGKRIKMPESDGDMEAHFEKIISVKKFSDLTAWVEAIGKTTDNTVSADTGTSLVTAQLAVEVEENETSISQDILRMLFVKTPSPIIEKDETRIAGKTFAITDDGNCLTKLTAEALEAVGASALIINNKDISSLPDCDGLIVINSSAGHQQYSVFDLFNMLKNCDMEKLGWLFVFDDAFGNALQSAGTEGTFTPPEGFPGFLKSLIHEYPGRRICSVQFETLFNQETFADIVMDELTTVKTMPELYYMDNERYYLCQKTVKADLTDKKPQEILNSDSVVVVFGGAQGITAQILSRLTKNYPCRYILIGRSDANLADGKYAGLETVDEVRRYLIDQEGMKNPREIEAKAKSIYKSSQIAKALASIEQAGGKAVYKCVDATDRSALRAAFMEIREEYGTIDGVIHAAGVLEDKLFRVKEVESFARVYNTKAEPIKTVIEELLPDLKLLVMFSSMSSTFGNAGQCDYAAGNSVLDASALILQRLRPDIRAIVFNWGPWKGAGMVNEGLEMEFQKRGISFIEPDKGYSFFVSELAYENASSVLAISIDEEIVPELINSAYHKLA